MVDFGTGGGYLSAVEAAALKEARRFGEYTQELPRAHGTTRRLGR